jgi:hypothetical protein
MIKLLIGAGAEARAIALGVILLRLIQLLRVKGLMSGPEARSIFAAASLALAPAKGTIAVDDAIRLLGQMLAVLPEKEV